MCYQFTGGDSGKLLTSRGINDVKFVIRDEEPFTLQSRLRKVVVTSSRVVTIEVRSFSVKTVLEVASSPESRDILRPTV